MSEPYDFDRELEAVERFVAAVQAGQIGTSEAMAAYRDRHRPAIERLRAELASFHALLDEAEGAGSGEERGPMVPEEAPGAVPPAPAEADDAAVHGDVGTEPETSASGAPELWQADPDEPDPGAR
jgi:hypothetical protein